MHPALMIAVMEERDREVARRTKDAWKRPAPQPRRMITARRHLHWRGRGRLAAAFGRGLAFFS
jgi:hypothetical protein